MKSKPGITAPRLTAVLLVLSIGPGLTACGNSGSASAAGAGTAAVPVSPASPGTVVGGGQTLGRLGTATLTSLASPTGLGIAVSGAGLASAQLAQPLDVIYNTTTAAEDDAELGLVSASLAGILAGQTGTTLSAEPGVQNLRGGYDTLVTTADGFEGRGTVALGTSGARVLFDDHWIIDGSHLRLVRDAKVVGTATGGIQTGLRFKVNAAVVRTDLDYFIPGTVYGSTDHIESNADTPLNDIGSAATYGAGYGGLLHIREDRLSAPLIGLHFADGSSATVLDTRPDGNSTAADSADQLGAHLIDTRFRFGALVAEQPGSSLSFGYFFPGSEGETSYPGVMSGTKGADSLHRWVRREHPVTDGLTQHYELAFNFGSGQTWRAFLQSAERWAWAELQPPLFAHDTTTVRTTLITHLAGVVGSGLGGTGFPMFWNPKTGQQYFHNAQLPFGPQYSNIGFLGRALTNAGHLIVDATLHPADFEDPAGVRAAGEAAMATMLGKLPMNPPLAEGIDLTSGELQGYPYPDGPLIHLRSLVEDYATMMGTYAFDKSRGHAHPDWLTAATDLGNFLLAQQATDGSIPRTWLPGGVPMDSDGGTSPIAITFLLRLADASGDDRFRTAALKIGALAETLQGKGQYWGATADHSGSIDKESAAFALRSYLELYKATGEPHWLDSARGAADAYETWTYLWNVPMPVDAVDTTLTWDRKESTVGIALVSTGGSGVDHFNEEITVDFARIYDLTGDRHYLDVARLFLNNSFNSVALPGDLHGLFAPGWAYEYWSLVYGRGTSGFNDWIPWMSAASLYGILRLEVEAPSAYTELTGLRPSAR